MAPPWPLIGRLRSRDLNTGLWLVETAPPSCEKNDARDCKSFVRMFLWIKDTRVIIHHFWFSVHRSCTGRYHMWVFHYSFLHPFSLSSLHFNNECITILWGILAAVSIRVKEQKKQLSDQLRISLYYDSKLISPGKKLELSSWRLTYTQKKIKKFTWRLHSGTRVRCRGGCQACSRRRVRPPGPGMRADTRTWSQTAARLWHGVWNEEKYYRRQKYQRKNIGTINIIKDMYRELDMMVICE